MEEFIARGPHAYIINVSANAYNCWIIAYWGKKGEYGEQVGGDLEDNSESEIMRRLNDLKRRNRGLVRSAAFGSGKDTVFVRASSTEHQWSFRWHNLPFECEMMV